MSDEHGLGLLAQCPLGGLDLVLPVLFVDFGLVKDVGWYGRSGRGLNRSNMGCSIGADRFVLSIGYDKSQMSQIVVFVGVWYADGIGVECGLQGFDQGACGALAWFMDSWDSGVNEIQGFILRSYLE